MTIDSDEELEGVRRAGRVVAEARDAMLEAVRPGVSTGELDALGRDVLRSHGARSAPRLAYGFPGWTCISVNDEAAHGVPSFGRYLEDGDLVNVDVSAELDGFWADTGASAPVGRADRTGLRLVGATRAAQRDAMAAARSGSSLRSVARAVERSARASGFEVVADLCGHGVGRHIHEPPNVASAVRHAERTLLWEGLVLAVEPFLSTGATTVVTGADGWTLRTPDGSRTAQFEHTIVVTRGDPIVMTA